MNGILSIAGLLVLVAWAEGSLVIAMPGLNGPEIHRGGEAMSR